MVPSGVWMSLFWGHGGCIGLGGMVSRGGLWGSEGGQCGFCFCFPENSWDWAIGGMGIGDCISVPWAAMRWIVSFGLRTSVKFSVVGCLW